MQQVQSIIFVVTNIDLLKYHEDKRVEAYVNMLHSYGCYIFPNYVTRVTPNSSTLIDHIYTNNASDDLQNFNLVHDISDHYPSFISAGSINPSSITKKLLVVTWNSFS